MILHNIYGYLQIFYFIFEIHFYLLFLLFLLLSFYCDLYLYLHLSLILHVQKLNIYIYIKLIKYTIPKNITIYKMIYKSAPYNELSPKFNYKITQIDTFISWKKILKFDYKIINATNTIKQNLNKPSPDHLP